MLSVEEALERVLSLVHPLETESVPILEGLDRVLGEDIYSADDIPPFANSAMDGYAIRSEDVATARAERPVILKVIGEVAAGQVPDVVVEQGTAVRIMTGAPMPIGADAVVRFEDTNEGRRLTGAKDINKTRAEIAIFSSAPVGANIRMAGEDVRAGEKVLLIGTVLRPQEIGLLAALGYTHVKVHRRPRVAILATGDELLEAGEPLRPGKIRNSNEYSNAALVLRYGGIPIRLGIARDNVNDLKAKLKAGLEQQVDLFVTSAGVSVGDYDIVKDVLGEMGQMNFWQVRMKPGKPLAVGVISGVPLLGLPGNPVSAMISFEQFVRPCLRVMEGRRAWKKQTIQVMAEHDIENSSRRRHYIRAIVTIKPDGTYWARSTGDQGSGILTSMVSANALLIIPEDVSFVRRGEPVTAQMLDWPEV